LHPNTPIATTRRRNAIGKKRNDHEAGSSHAAKEEKPRMRVPLLSSIARMFYENWMPCEGWNDVHLLGGWRLSKVWVPIPQVSHSGPERDAEI
jgi:hypothetical protein